jgi:hypothetical protein
MQAARAAVAGPSRLPFLPDGTLVTGVGREGGQGGGEGGEDGQGQDTPKKRGGRRVAVEPPFALDEPREALAWWFVVQCRWICALIRPVQCDTIDPVTVEGDRLWDLLRSLDDPEHLEFPADFNRDETKNRFDQLVDRLNTAFSCACKADSHVQDASPSLRCVLSWSCWC